MQNDLISRSALVDMLLTENQRCITSTGHELSMSMIVNFIENQHITYSEKEFDVLKQDGQLLYKQGVIDGYNNAIYDFVEKATEEQIKYDCPLDMHDIEKIAKQLKAGGTDE